jgi:phospho-N-acetylmuramoyl-pentapeptide-transferase
VLYHFFVPLIHRFRFLNLFTYITFRAAGAAVTALVLAFIVGPIVIRRLRRDEVMQTVREGTPDTHAGKGQTPTMGGLIILFSSLLSTLLWARLSSRYIWLAVMVTAAMGGIGLLDDVLKLRQKRAGQKNEGLVERYKLAG